MIEPTDVSMWAPAIGFNGAAIGGLCYAVEHPKL
jgi:hypothetical protein